MEAIMFFILQNLKNTLVFALRDVYFLVFIGMTEAKKKNIPSFVTTA